MPAPPKRRVTRTISPAQSAVGEPLYENAVAAVAHPQNRGRRRRDQPFGLLLLEQARFEPDAGGGAHDVLTGGVADAETKLMRELSGIGSDAVMAGDRRQ